MKKSFVVGLAIVLPAILLGAPAHSDKGGPTKAVAVLTALGDSKAAGVVTFTVKDGAIEITGEITGLTPGEHAFHVHEFGDITSKDGMSTGGHFNPEHKAHGGPDAHDRHVGDLGNIKADDSGKVELHITDKLIQLSGPDSIIGRGLIVHAKADDFKTQPTGNAGGRVACGVIGVAKGETAAAPSAK
jgi:Cu-Zn family superoxide dismutase